MAKAAELLIYEDRSRAPGNRTPLKKERKNNERFIQNNERYRK